MKKTSIKKLTDPFNHSLGYRWHGLWARSTGQALALAGSLARSPKDG